MHDDRADVNGRGVFLHESFNLAHFHTIGHSQLFCGHGCRDFGGGGSGDRNDRYQIGVHEGMGDQRCVLRGKEVA